MSKINKYEYAFLKGDKVMWDIKGAAFNVVFKWCAKKGYGHFGKPTTEGLKVIEEYEVNNSS